MANITPTVAYADPGDPQSGFVITWSAITAADTALNSPITLALYTDRTVQMTGTFDSATVVLQGSLDGSTFFPLTDPQGNAISKTAAAGEAVSEATLYFKPTHSGGAGSQSVTVKVFCTGYRRR